mmetsp:Transcript_110812/g.220407  ORF Transcript_110812/g.220407 Transcript_110812/m.220407 type:complete len:160 (-) Transcript_110812:50-529(-)
MLMLAAATSRAMRPAMGMVSWAVPVGHCSRTCHWSPLQQQSRFGGWRRETGPKEKNPSSFAPYPMVPWGIKRSATYRDAKKTARRAAERARRAAEEKGMLLDPKKQLRIELKRNTGIGWYRSLQIIKHLEMHERGIGPPIDQAMRERITQIARVVRMGK